MPPTTSPRRGSSPIEFPLNVAHGLVCSPDRSMPEAPGLDDHSLVHVGPT
jgi:hypothetical protein